MSSADFLPHALRNDVVGCAGGSPIEEQMNAKLDLLVHKFEKLERWHRSHALLQSQASATAGQGNCFHELFPEGRGSAVPAETNHSALSVDLKSVPDHALVRQLSKGSLAPHLRRSNSQSVPSVAEMCEAVTNSLAAHALWRRGRSECTPEEPEVSFSPRVPRNATDSLIPVPSSQPNLLPEITTGEADEGCAGSHSVSVVPSPDAGMHASPKSPLPKSTRSSFENPVASRDRVATMTSLRGKSVAQILSDPVVEEQEDKDAPSRPVLDAGSRFMKRLPLSALVLLGFLVVLQIGGFITLKSLGQQQRTGAVFLHLASFLAGVTGIRCAFLLKKALRSEALQRALCRLEQLVSDSKWEWSAASDKEFWKFALSWVLAATVFTGLQVREAWNAGVAELSFQKQVTQVSLTVVQVLIFSTSSLLLVTVAFVQSHLLLGLDKALDCYCFCIMDEMDFEFAVSSWNSLQALLQCIGREFADSFFTSQACGALGVAVVLASGTMFAFQIGFDGALLAEELALALPVLFFLMLNFRVFYHGSSLTEKCVHIPSFVNQIPTEHCIDHGRQYLVRFISDSSPGFVVKDLRVSRAMFVKICVVTGGVLSALIGVLSRAY